jgi:hypothetical protein
MAASLLYMLELSQNMKESEADAMICEQVKSISDAVIGKQTAVDDAKASCEPVGNRIGICQNTVGKI